MSIKCENENDTSFLPNKVYLDYNATTPMAPEVIETITATMKDAWGNPSSNYEDGKIAKKIIDEAREDVARVIGGRASDIIFLSGGTEANNLVIYSSVVHFRRWMLSQEGIKKDMKPHIITTNVEHDSIKLPLKLRYFIEADVTYVNTANLVQTIMDNIRPSTCLITVMLANNETGIIFSVSQIAKQLCDLNKRRETEGLFRILLHTDAAQAIGKIPVDATELMVDYMSIVGHKMYGPRIGALYVRWLKIKTPIYPIFYGGNQENGYRSGTENTPMIAGLGKACCLINENLPIYTANMKKMRTYLERQLKKVFGNYVKINCVDPCKYDNPDECSRPPCGPKRQHLVFPRLPNTVSISFYYPEVTGAKILDKCTILKASTGSACHSKDECKSVLEASGVCSFHAARTIRLSIGRETRCDQIDLIVNDLRQATQILNEMADPLA